VLAKGAPAPVLGLNPVKGNSAIINALTKRTSLLQNLSVRYEERTRYPNSPRVNALTRHLEKMAEEKYPGTHIVDNPPRENYSCVLSVLKRRVYLLRAMTPPTVKLFAAKNGPGVAVTRRVRTWTPQRDESLSYQLTQEHRPIGEIRAATAPPRHLSLLAALGIRGADARRWDWVTPKRIANMTIHRLGNGRFTLRQDRPSGYAFEWVYETRPGLRMIEMKALVSHGRYRNLLLKLVRCSAFREIGGVQLPGRIQGTTYAPPISKDTTGQTLIFRVHYAIGKPSNTPFRYYIVWPKGCTVIDERTGSRFQIKSPTVLSDKEIMSRLKKRDKTGPHRPQ